MTRPTIRRARNPQRLLQRLLVLCCAILLVPGASLALPQQGATAPAPAGAAEETAPKIPPDQLDALVAPIALYPDPLLAQTLVASTYPLEIIQLQQWLARNPGLKDKALEEAVAKQPWDPSIQSMAAVPEVVKRLSEDIQWTTDLGNAFLAQQADVMEAVQRMRKKAADKGALTSNEQQVVETKVIEQKTVIVVQPANPEVVYVPSYSPTVVYGPPVYPYPPIYYPPYPAGGALIGFGIGVAWGAAWGGSCCGCGWGGNDVNINVNNNFNKNTNINRGGNNNWQHNPSHRGGTPYSNKATANKYGGSARGGASDRAAGGAGARSGTAGAMDRGTGGAGSRTGTPSAADRGTGGAGSRGGTPSTMDRGTGSAGSRPSSAGSMDRGAGGASAGGAQVGNRNIPSGSGSSVNSGFSGGSRGYSGSSAKSSSSRGASSMGSRGGGGGGRGGGRR